ncbi:MAG: amino acid--tRNA ligase-related protein [Pseudomonadota bacterium]|nr:amino acid--tRNA ligase-related protein [Pseudomonadota bacterium]
MLLPVSGPLDAARLRQRAAILHALRTTLHECGFLEVHPPTIVDGPALEETLEPVHADGRFLHTSPEFALKRVLAAGLPRIYSIVPCFRDEEWGTHHAREFTMLELYFANAGYLDLIPVVEELVAASAQAIGVAAPVFRRRTVAELFAGDIPPDDDTFFLRWVDQIEPALTEPTFVLDYPARHAALAEVRGPVSERLEVYLGGLELGNGFSELRDPHELRARFHASAARRIACGRPPHPIDEGVIAASGHMPRAAGIAIGVDRLVMALTGETDIARVQVSR